MTKRVFKKPISVGSPGSRPKLAISKEETQIDAHSLAGGLRAWWQADAGFMSGSVVEWLDRIGSKRLSAQSLPTGAVSIPVMQPAAIKGRAAVSFNNTSLIAPNDQTFFPMAADFSFAAVCKLVPTDAGIIVANQAPFANATYLLRNSTEKFTFAMNGFSVSGADGSAPSSTTHVVICGYTAATRTLTLRQNGALVQTQARAQHVNQSCGLRIGAHVDGATATFAIDGGGLIPLIMAFSGDITAEGRAADVALLENWLIAQYQ